MARAKRRVISQTGSNKHSSKNVATKSWRKDRLQMKFDRLAGPVTVRNINDAPDEGDNDRLN